ncbi:spermidine/putrescine transport system permease protein [Tistlia consotensis]|uniref:Spermidine/putrescine transport system permease protein n=2 Tax=Tistlia TaxID=1321364 RepID=A0A1Y6CEX9_9PROT|nr:ABC transporter permease [Tistlia consotensis]SMF51618.1 spermidine/putrescine transport system permease protein [Tistlia consotensis USBA 355]SNR83904.1 spermidine/putrescine transport system permease protein [Tistlia consotensis]
MRWYALAIYVFLYLPIVLIVFFSFNSGRYAMDWQGFSFQWYGRAFANRFAMQALATSLEVGLWTAALSTVIGTLTAIGLERTRGWPRRLFDGLIYVAIMVPGVVIGIATLIAFVTLFGALNPLLAHLFGPDGPQLAMGRATVVGAHVLFNLAVVTLIVRARLAGLDRSLIEASEDLYATPLGTFRQVVLPLLTPAILAGFLLSFTFSFEDFIIAFFVAGPNNTLPIYIFSSIRRGITPEINAIGTVVLIVSLTLLITAQFLLRSRDRAVAGKG